MVDGGRILIAWIPSFFQLSIERICDQLIHCKAKNLTWNKDFYLTVLYGMNDPILRENLWRELKSISRFIDGPWLISEDFNRPLEFDDRLGRQVHYGEMAGFRDCVQFCGISEMNKIGCQYTLNNKQSGQDRVHSRIDRILINED